MNAVWTIARHTVRECVRRRVFLVVPIATVGFLALYATGNHFAFRHVGNSTTGFGGGLVDQRALAGSTLVGLGMFMTLFLASSLGIFLTFSTIRGDAEQGVLQPLVVRPVARWGVVVGRYVGASVICASYAVFLYAGTVLITWVIGSWAPSPLLLPGVAMVGAVEVVIALSLLGSTVLTALPNGIAMFMLYGAGLLGGLLGELGRVLSSPSLETTGKLTAWVLPYEALYQASLNYLTSSATGLTRVVVRLGPLGGAESGGPFLGVWALIYVIGVGMGCIALFARRDL
ncbi:MAG: type transport system permease protein [Actinomycetota bacterium]|jgi:ABC-type transport system involved in multi-copper enzyme maturation permease subunit|nr:type transport system permease protein [Actinomycetota bacterium]